MVVGVGEVVEIKEEAAAEVEGVKEIYSILAKKWIPLLSQKQHSAHLEGILVGVHDEVQQSSDLHCFYLRVYPLAYSPPQGLAAEAVSVVETWDVERLEGGEHQNQPREDGGNAASFDGNMEEGEP